MHYQPHHHHPPHPHPHPHHQPHWPSGRQAGGLMPGPPPPPPQPYGHQQPVPPLLPNHPYYPPSSRALMHPVESASGNGRFSFPHNPHQRHHPPLMQPPYYPPGPPQPLMQSTARNHHPINRYPPPTRPFDLPHPMQPIGNAGLHPSNSNNYNQFKYESEERLAVRRAIGDTTSIGTNPSNNRRGGSQQTESNGKTKMNNNPLKSNTKSSGNSAIHIYLYLFFLISSDMDQLFLEREKLLAKLNEISDSGDLDEQHASMNNYNPIKATNSQDDEGEEGEISESD
jgi:hypothetical protein